MVILGAMEPPHHPPIGSAAPEPSEPRPLELDFRLTRDRVTLSALLSRASEAWSRDLSTWVLAMLLYFLIGVGIPTALGVMWGFFSTIEQTSDQTGVGFDVLDAVVRVVLQVAQLVLSAVFILGMWAMAMRGLHGRRTTLAVLFSQLSKIWKYILQSLALGLGLILIVVPVIVLIFLAFVGPMSLDTPMSEIVDKAGRPFGIAALVLLPLYVYIVTGLVFMQTELAYNDDAGPIDAMIWSWRIAKGKRWRIIGTGFVAGLIWLGSGMLCGIGLLFGAPFAMLLLGALYLALRSGADVPVANTGTTLGRDY